MTTLKPPRSPPRAASSEQKLLLSPKKFQGSERAVSEAEGRDPVSTTSHSADPGKWPWQAPTLGPQGSLEFPVPPGLPRPVSDLFTTEDGWCSGMTPCGMDTHWPARATGGGPGPTNLSWAPLPLLLLKEGVCLPCPLLLQAHRSLNPELSGRSPDSPGPHLILQGI